MDLLIEEFSTCSIHNFPTLMKLIYEDFEQLTRLYFESDTMTFQNGIIILEPYPSGEILMNKETLHEAYIYLSKNNRAEDILTSMILGERPHERVETLLLTGIIDTYLSQYID